MSSSDFATFNRLEHYELLLSHTREYLRQDDELTSNLQPNPTVSSSEDPAEIPRRDLSKLASHLYCLNWTDPADDINRIVEDLLPLPQEICPSTNLESLIQIHEDLLTLQRQMFKTSILELRTMRQISTGIASSDSPSTDSIQTPALAPDFLPIRLLASLAQQKEVGPSMALPQLRLAQIWVEELVESSRRTTVEKIVDEGKKVGGKRVRQEVLKIANELV